MPNLRYGGPFGSTKTVWGRIVSTWPLICRTLGFLYFISGHNLEAVPLLQRALNIRVKALGLSDKDTVETAETYAKVLRALHRDLEAQDVDLKVKSGQK